MQLDIYIAVEDLDRSVDFYAAVFDTRPISRTETYAGFAVGQGRFGLLLASSYAMPVQRGNSAVPTIKVADLAAWFQKVQPLALKTTEIIEKGTKRLFMFLDPDGNVVEVAALD